MQIKGITELFPDMESNSKILHKLPMLNFIAGLLRSLSLQNIEAKASYCTQIYAFDSVVFGNLKEISEKISHERNYILLCADEN